MQGQLWKGNRKPTVREARQHLSLSAPSLGAAIWGGLVTVCLKSSSTTLKQGWYLSPSVFSGPRTFASQCIWTGENIWTRTLGIVKEYNTKGTSPKAISPMRYSVSTFFSKLGSSAFRKLHSGWMKHHRQMKPKLHRWSQSNPPIRTDILCRQHMHVVFLWPIASWVCTSAIVQWARSGSHHQLRFSSVSH